MILRGYHKLLEYRAGSGAGSDLATSISLVLSLAIVWFVIPFPVFVFNMELFSGTPLFSS
jgi:hypothetical protein